MSDQLPGAPEPAETARWTISLDARDVLAIAGAAMLFVGVWAFDWRLALLGGGAGLLWLARRLMGW